MVSKAPNQCRIKCFLEQMGFSNVDGGGSFFSVANRLMLAVGLNFIAWRKLDSRMAFSLLIGLAGIHCGASGSEYAG